jgi:hypothetical protein
MPPASPKRTSLATREGEDILQEAFYERMEANRLLMPSSRSRVACGFIQIALVVPSASASRTPRKPWIC